MSEENEATLFHDTGPSAGARGGAFSLFSSRPLPVSTSASSLELGNGYRGHRAHSGGVSGRERP